MGRDKHQRFAQEYVVDHNAKQAAIRAGYSPRTAEQQGSRLLRNAKVKALIGSGTAQVLKRAEVQAEDVVRELARIGLADVGQLFDADGQLRPVHELPEDVRRAVASIEATEEGVTKVRLWPKVEALGLLARKFQLLVDKVDHHHSGSVALETLIGQAVQQRKGKEAA